MSLESAIILLLLVMDPLGNVPFFASALDRVDPGRQTRVVVRELVIAYVVMVGFLFAGRPMLAVFGISQAALTLAGGVVLFLIALRMVFPPASGPAYEDLPAAPVLRAENHRAPMRELEFSRPANCHSPTTCARFRLPIRPLCRALVRHSTR